MGRRCAVGPLSLLPSATRSLIPRRLDRRNHPDPPLPRRLRVDTDVPRRQQEILDAVLLEFGVGR